MKALEYIRSLSVVLFVVGMTSGCCKEQVELGVFTGHRSMEECARFARELPASDFTIICPGEEVTICWAGNVASINLEPGFGTQGSSGIKYLTVSGDTTVAAIPVNSCAGRKEVLIDVITGDTPSTWDARWDLTCKKIGFEIKEQFVSTNVRARDITATWEPILEYPGGGTATCTTPPFLEGFHVEEVFGFNLPEPFLTNAFSRLLRAVGHWAFAWEAVCPTDWSCKQNASLPFDLTLTCDKP